MHSSCLVLHTLPGGLALAVLRYDEGDGFNRSGVVTEAHAMILQLLAAVFGIPGAACSSLEHLQQQLLSACDNIRSDCKRLSLDGQSWQDVTRKVLCITPCWGSC